MIELLQSILWILIWCFWFPKCRYENVPLEINRLRCRVNYHALRFLPATEEMANILVSRMHNRTGKPQPFMYVHSLCLLSPNTFRQFELVRSIGARSQRMWFSHGNFRIRSGTRKELIRSSTRTASRILSRSFRVIIQDPVNLIKALSEAFYVSAVWSVCATCFMHGTILTEKYSMQEQLMSSFSSKLMQLLYQGVTFAVWERHGGVVILQLCRDAQREGWDAKVQREGMAKTI